MKTAGFACPNRACGYYGITDTEIHALVGDGLRGQSERIQRFRCQACQTTFRARLHTPLYRLKTSSHRVGLVLVALAEGLDVSAAERVFGIRHATITRWLLRAGSHAQTLHERSFCHLQIPHLQLDELRTRLRSHTQVLWLWVAIDRYCQLSDMMSLFSSQSGKRSSFSGNFTLFFVERARKSSHCGENSSMTVNKLTIPSYFCTWRNDGTWERIHKALRERVRVKQGREPTPSAAIIDSQSVKTSQKGVRGYDGGKRVKGRKRHLLVDTNGLILHVLVHEVFWLN